MKTIPEHIKAMSREELEVEVASQDYTIEQLTKTLAEGAESLRLVEDENAERQVREVELEEQVAQLEQAYAVTSAKLAEAEAVAATAAKAVADLTTIRIKPAERP